jgi:hypothetical protein
MQSPEPSEEVQKQASQPLYEFIAENPSQSISPPAGEQTAEVKEAEAARTHEAREARAAAPPFPGAERMPQPSEEEVRQGLVYPPPPSFYQNAQMSPWPPPFPPPPVNNQFPPAMGPGYASNAFVQAPPPDPAKKRSRTWIWIVVAVLAVALLSSCGFCGWAYYSLFSSTFNQVTGSISVVEDYYAAIEARNYASAYSYLDPQGMISGLTLDQFTRQATSLDNQYGAVLSYTPGTPTFATSATSGTSGADFSLLTVTINVRRPRLSYTALLTLRRVGGTWKIVDFDRI